MMDHRCRFVYMLQAIRFKQTGTTCSAQWSTVDPLLEKAIASTTNATTALTDASLTTAITDSQAVCESRTPIHARSKELRGP